MKTPLRVAAALVIVALMTVGLIGFSLSGQSSAPQQRPSATPTASRTPTVADSAHPACVAAAASIQDLITTLGSIATSNPADLVRDLTRERAGIASAVAKDHADPAAPAVGAVGDAITGILELQRVNPKGDFTPVVTKVANLLTASTTACAS